MTNEKIFRAAIWRRAIKDFCKHQIIADSDFRTIMEVARYGPSSLGLEPWKVLIVQDPNVRDAIRPYCTGAYRQLDSASHFAVISITTDLNPESDYFRDIKQRVHGINDADYLDFVSKFSQFQKQKADLTDTRKRIDWAGKQAYIALGSMMLAAALLGIDSCPIEGFVPHKVEEVLEELELFDSSSNQIVVMVAFGYRVDDPKTKKTRCPSEEVFQVV